MNKRINWNERTPHEKKGLRLMASMLLLFVTVFGFGFVYPAVTGKFDQRHQIDISKKDCCCCECSEYIKKDKVEYQYEQLVRPIHVEAKGFNGIILRDSVGGVFVVTDDKFLHEVIEYSYNVGDTIR